MQTSQMPMCFHQQFPHQASGILYNETNGFSDRNASHIHQFVGSSFASGRLFMAISHSTPLNCSG